MKLIYTTLCLVILISNYLSADDKIEIAGDIFQIGLPSAALYMTFVQDDAKGRVEFWEGLLSSTIRPNSFAAACLNPLVPISRKLLKRV